MQETQEVPVLMKKSDLAAMLGWSVRSVDRMIQREEGPPFIRLNGRVYFRATAVNRWLHDLECEGGGAPAPHQPTKTVRRRQSRSGL